MAYDASFLTGQTGLSGANPVAPTTPTAPAAPSAPATPQALSAIGGSVVGLGGAIPTSYTGPAYTSTLQANTSAPATVKPDMINTPPIKLPPTGVASPYVAPAVAPPQGTVLDQSGNATVAPPTKDTSTNDALKKIGIELGTKADVAKSLQEEQQLAQKTQQATLDYNALNRAKFDSAQRIQDIYNSNKTAAGKDAAIRDLARIDNANIANLALTAQVSQGLLSAAEKTIKDKLDFQFEPLEKQADFYFNLAKNENNDLSDSEKLKLTQIGDKKKEETASVRKVATEVQSALASNGKVSLISDIDKVIRDYEDGKITASAAQSKMYQAAGIYGTSAADRAATAKIEAEVRNSGALAPGIASTPANITMANAFNNAIAGMPANRSSQAKATFNSYLAQGDVAGAKDFIVRMAVETAPVADQAQIIGRMQAVNSLTDIQSLLQQAKDKGAPTNILSGNAVNIAQKLGTSTNQDLSYIGGRIQTLLQTYRRSMTGVAFSPSESKEYAKIMPDLTDTNTLNDTKIAALIDGFDSNNRTALSFYIGSTNYDKIYGASASAKLPSDKASAPAKSGSFGDITWTVEP